MIIMLIFFRNSFAFLFHHIQFNCDNCLYCVSVYKARSTFSTRNSLELDLLALVWLLNRTDWHFDRHFCVWVWNGQYRLLNAIVSHCTTRGSGIISPASFNRERWNIVWANLPLNPAQEKNFSQIGQIVQEIWQNEFIPISSRWKNPDFFVFVGLVCAFEMGQGHISGIL